MSEGNIAIGNDFERDGHVDEAHDDAVDVSDEYAKRLLEDTPGDEVNTTNDEILAFLKMMHVNMQNIDSRLEQVENINVANLAPKHGSDHGSRKRKATKSLSVLHQETIDSDDEDALLSKVLADTADPAEKASNTSSNDPKNLGDADTLLSDLAQELTEQEPTSPAVNDDLAAMLNKRWAEKLSDKKLTGKLDSIHRPDNCSALVVPRVNPEIWSNLPKFVKRKDLRTANIQRNLSKAGSSLICTTNKLLAARQQTIEVDPTEIIKSNMDIIAILGHAFVELSHHRRDAIKPNLNKEFVALCSEKVPVTANLFGDDLQAECNNIKTSHKLSQSASKGRDKMDRRRYTATPYPSRNTSESPRQPFLSQRKPWRNNKPWFPKSASKGQKQQQ
ncbi:uncharacterized protein LOC114516343 [Dendronephthya gigantea]|uniref:uncharacterized protein LOC114516343 n=1 Tax=Dendronephthya gigantea TaxID=151771 RepID=UPI00106ADD8A|nr:uncharacterized protein LOC114516343 [Dendronephthya gigantea]